jgi:DUF2950 family protein
MMTRQRTRSLLVVKGLLWICFYGSALFGAEGPQAFDTPEQAVAALLDAAAKFDVPALGEIFGPGQESIYLTGEHPLDRERALEFASKAREKQSVTVDPADPMRAHLIVGAGGWPFPVPLEKRGDKWFYDAAAGKQEILYRRIGANELDAIALCHGYVEAQREYAMQARAIYEPNAYAQKIISTPGEHDGLAWQRADGTWAGPVGEKVAHALEQGYRKGATPYHGYFFKILKGQGPAAPLGQLDFVVKGVMIGGFALVAAPARYGVTGVKTFIVSHDGIVYERDFGEATLEAFGKMERYNPDETWTPLDERDQ